jgi:hypothetical protein
LVLRPSVGPSGTEKDMARQPRSTEAIFLKNKSETLFQ